MAKKIVDGINMSMVKAQEVKSMIKAFNEAGLGVTCKTGANPLGMAKAFVKALELVEDQSTIPSEIADYYNLIVEEAPPDATDGEPNEPIKPKATKPVVAPKATKPVVAPKADKKAEGGPTKKSIIIAAVSKAKGASVEEMAQACVDAGLGDLDTNKRTVKLWLRKLGFKVVVDAKGKFRKTE